MKTSESGVMHAVLHNFGDWEIETRHMSRIEKSIYFDMRTIYLKTGKSLKGDVGYLYRLFSCSSDEEKAALDFVLSDKFTLDKKTNTYKQREWDTILKNYKYGNGIADGYADKLRTQSDANTDTCGQNANANTDAHNRRKAFNERLSIMVDALSGIGVKASIRDGSAKLKELCKQNQINVEQLFADTYGQNTDTNTDTADNDGQKNNEKNHAITNNHKPLTNNNKEREHNLNSISEIQEASLSSPEELPLASKEKTAITVYCRSQGIMATSTQSLDNLIAAGATMQMFVDAIAIAKDRGNSKWSYVMGIARNLLEESHKPPPKPSEKRKDEEPWMKNGKFQPFEYVNREAIARNQEQRKAGLRLVGEIIDITPPEGVVNALQ